MIISLMKILPCKEYVEYFLDGKLYCNTVRYFRDKRYDEFEGADFLHPTTLRLDSHTIPEEDLAGPVILHSNFVADLNVFCMFAWRAPKVGDDDVLIDLESQLGSIDAYVAEFGRYTVVVKNTTEFFRRVGLAVARRGNGVLSGAHGAVRYINPDTFRTNPTDPLRTPLFKQKRFAHQKEYRFVFQTGHKPAGHLELPIGDIRDIAFCMRTEDIYDSVKVGEEVDPSAS